MKESKTKPTTVSVSSYVAAIESEEKRKDAKTLIALMQKVTGEKAKMWGPSIIGFGSYHYRYDSGREGDAPLVGFSPRKPAIVLYLHAGLDGADAMLKRLGKCEHGKGCLYIKRLSDVNADVLEELIAQTAAAMRKKYPD